MANADIGPHNFKDHFDADILEYVTEDIRLSTLQRKLVRENNTLVSHALACQVRNPLYSYTYLYIFMNYFGHGRCDLLFLISDSWPLN